MNNIIEPQWRHTRWIGRLATNGRTRIIAAVLTGFCGLVALVSAVGKLTSLVRYPKLGLAALSGLAMYFAGAVIAHLRVGDGAADIAIPLGYVLVMSITAALRGATLSPYHQRHKTPEETR